MDQDDQLDGVDYIQLGFVTIIIVVLSPLWASLFIIGWIADKIFWNYYKEKK